MGNSRLPGGKTRRAERRFRDRGFDVNTPGSFARPGLRHPSADPPVQIDILTRRSGVGLTERIANPPLIPCRCDVEQWKHIPRKAESGKEAFL